MKLIYIDPHCSGLQVVDCNSKETIEGTLDQLGMNENGCGGDVVYYVFVDSHGQETRGSLDFT